MKRIFQLGLWMLLLTAVVAPVLEYFDRWDAPGLGSDTEFALFALILLVCLLLAVCKLLSDRAQRTDMEILPLHMSQRPPTFVASRLIISPPLRI